jgi:hypothetical protein
LLIHPNRQWKLIAEQMLVAQLSPEVTLMNFEEYGDFWLERRDLDYSFQFYQDTLRIQLLSLTLPASDVRLVIHNGASLNAVKVVDINGNAVAFSTQNWNVQDLILRFGSGILKFEQSTNINTIIDERGFSLFPNPASDITNLVYKLQQEEQVQVQLSDISGKILWSRDVKASAGQGLVRIPVWQLTQGMYMVHFKTNTINKTFKLIRE